MYYYWCYLGPNPSIGCVYAMPGTCSGFDRVRTRLRKGPLRVPYLPALVTIISVPISLNVSQSSLEHSSIVISFPGIGPVFTLSSDPGSISLSTEKAFAFSLRPVKWFFKVIAPTFFYYKFLRMKNRLLPALGRRIVSRPPLIVNPRQGHIGALGNERYPSLWKCILQRLLFCGSRLRYTILN